LRVLTQAFEDRRHPKDFCKVEFVTPIPQAQACAGEDFDLLPRAFDRQKIFAIVCHRCTTDDAASPPNPLRRLSSKDISSRSNPQWFCKKNFTKL
jgi:hypothetical protein